MTKKRSHKKHHKKGGRKSGKKHRIKKTTGDTEVFVRKKYLQSMRLAGIEHSLAQEVLRMVTHDENNLVSTDKLHAATESALVKKNDLVAAARYNLKRAIVDLGPSGFPFEQYIAHVFNAYGYKTKTNQFVNGKCVRHEIDVVAERGNSHYMIECKHHHYSGAKTNIRVALYVYARFLDVQHTWNKQESISHKNHVPWLVTNTKITVDAISYADCMGMKVLAWHHPRGKGLNEHVEAKGLYPITVLSGLNKSAKKSLFDKNIILVQQLAEIPLEKVVRITGLKRAKVKQLLITAQQLLTEME